MEEGKKRDCLVEKMLLFDLDTPKNLLVLGRRNISKDQKIKKYFSNHQTFIIWDVFWWTQNNCNENSNTKYVVIIKCDLQKRIYLWILFEFFAAGIFQALLFVRNIKKIGENLTEFQTQTSILYSTIPFHHHGSLTFEKYYLLCSA